MKIRLLGNIANNAYNMAVMLRSLGMDAKFIDDGPDTYAFSRPFWEDVDFQLDYSDLNEHRTLSQWKGIEDNLGWEARNTILRPSLSRLILNKVSQLSKLACSGNNDATRICFDTEKFDEDEKNFILSNGNAYSKTVSELRDCDVAIVFGVRAACCAYLASVPTIYFTYGGDIRVELAGLRKDTKVVSGVLRKILQSSSFVIDAYGCDLEIHNILGKNHLLKKSKYAFLPNINIELFQSPLDKNSCRDSLGFSKEKIIFFMPSRLDYFWKASDVFINAFKKAALIHDNIYLVISGWGADYNAVLSSLGDDRFSDCISVLPHAMSKPLLKKYFSAADVVVDQFKVGSLGSVSFEALCMGKPVLTYLAPFNLLNYPSPPPIFNAKTTNDVENAILKCAEDPVLRESVGRLSADWYREIYSSENLKKVLEGIKKYGIEHWDKIGGSAEKTFHNARLPIPDSPGWIEILNWPSPYRAGLAISNDCEYYSWKDFCEVHNWVNGVKGRGSNLGDSLGLPLSDSFWFFSDDQEALGMSYFSSIQGDKSPYAEMMAELIKVGYLDTLHTWGGFDLSGSCKRIHAQMALSELDRIGSVPLIWSNHGNNLNVQNLRGKYSGQYALGDDSTSDTFHADILCNAGIKYFWLDAYTTNRFSLGNSLGRNFTSELSSPDDSLWGDRLLCTDKLNSGQIIKAFRRFRGNRGPAPDLGNLGNQLSEENLDHLIKAGGATIIYQHFGCLRNKDGNPYSRGGEQIPELTRRGFERLASKYHGGDIWVAPLSFFLEYVNTVSKLRIEFISYSDLNSDLVIFGEDEELLESDLAGINLKITRDGWKKIRKICLKTKFEKKIDCINYSVSEYDDQFIVIKWKIPTFSEFPLA
jgi:glycosyltransferase involved in cell wall biosynthesis